MNITKSERPHISFFGCTNGGKSSLVNAVTNQQLSVVSDIKGTTTDAVEKSMEILPLGPVVIIDTAGVNDESNLGSLRINATKRILDKTDIAVLVVDSTIGLQKEDNNLIQEFKERKIPYIVVFNKCDLTPPPKTLPTKEYPMDSCEEKQSKSSISGWDNTAKHKFSKNTQINAKELRNNSTKQEKKLWKYLNKSQLGYKFRRQQPIGNYIADFYCSSLNLIIELDGGQHNENQNIIYDKKRTEFLNECGYRVIRIWNNDIDNNIEGVVEYIKMNLTPPPNPLPQGAGETTQPLKPISQKYGSQNTSYSVVFKEVGEIISSDLPPIINKDINSIKLQRTIEKYPPLEGGSKSSISGWGNTAIQKLDSQNLSNFQADNKSLFVSAKTGEGINELKEKLGHIINNNKKEKYIIRDRLKKNNIVILVIPIDESAPKGRIILPQQNVLREILDSHATAICTQPEELQSILNTITPSLVITDSQVFNQVKEIVPENILLTSFSILMANYKGKLESLIQSASILSKLNDGDIVLISEGCTHHRQCNDIGTVKFPKWIKDFSGKNIEFDFTQGGEFPSDLSKYKLIIHCGGCMINESEMQSRQKRAMEQKIPMVNYGMAIAYMNGILDRALEIFK